MIYSRLEIYPSKETKDRAVIVGEKAALRALATAIMKAADNPAGFHSIDLFKSNGHNYEILITKNISELEWQNLPTDPNELHFIKDFEDLKKSIS